MFDKTYKAKPDTYVSIYYNNNCMRLYSKGKPTNKMVFRVELLILQNMYYFLELKFSLCWKTNRSYFSMALYTLRSCLYANGFAVFFHYKQKERNQHKSIKSIVIITRIIISLQSVMYWNESTTQQSIMFLKNFEK